MNRKVSSNFSKVMVISVLIIIIAIVGIMFLIFKTNSIYAYSEQTIADAKEITTTAQQNRISNLETIRSTLGSNSTAGTTAVNLSGDWITPMPGIQANTSEKVMIGSLTAYKGYPWDATADTWFLNVIKAKCDLWDYLMSLGGPGPLANPNMTRDDVINDYWTYETRPSSKDPIPQEAIHRTGTTANGTIYTTFDGLECYYFCPMPIMFDKEFYSSGKWAKQSCADYTRDDFDKFKFACVLCPRSADMNDSSQWIYLPCVAGDVKGHTYPWGIVQTNVQVVNDHTVNIAAVVNGSEHNYRTDVDDLSTDEAVKRVLCDSRFNAHYGNVYDGVNEVFETTAIAEPDTTPMNHDYVCVGFITYKEA